MGSPYSLGVNTDFDLKEHEKAFDEMPEGAQKEAARPVMKALKDGTIKPDELPGLAARGQPPQPTPGQSPYGLPGVPQAGPPTEAQAAAGQSGPPPLKQVGPPTAAQAGYTPPSTPSQAALNPVAVKAQFPGPFADQAHLAQEAPVAPRSGLSTHDQLINDLKRVSSNTRPQGMAADELAAQGQAISQLPAVARANQGLSDQENYLKMQMGQPRPPLNGDLGGFLAMLSKPGGPNLAEGYHAPETAAAQRNRIMEALQKVQTDRQSLAGNVIAGVKASKGGSLGDILTAADQLKQQQGAVDPLTGAGAGLEDRNNRFFLGSIKSSMKELQDANASNQEAQRLLASGTSVGDTTFKDRFLKAMIGGRVTNFDLMRQSGDQSLANKAEQVIRSLDTGNMTTMSRAEYQDALRVMQDATRWESERRIADLRDVGIGNLKLPPDRVEEGLKLGGLDHIGAVPQSTLDQSANKSAHTVGAAGGATVQRMIRVKAPDGTVGNFPAGKALPKGYSRVGS